MGKRWPVLLSAPCGHASSPQDVCPLGVTPVYLPFEVVHPSVGKSAPGYIFLPPFRCLSQEERKGEETPERGEGGI